MNIVVKKAVAPAIIAAALLIGGSAIDAIGAEHAGEGIWYKTAAVESAGEGIWYKAGHGSMGEGIWY